MAGTARGLGLDVEQLAAEITDTYPDLQVVREGDTVRVRGSFPIVHEGEVLTRFQIAIELPRDFPRSMPIVRETDRRIPWIDKRHMNPNGDACVLVPEEWMVRPEGERSLRGFLDGPVRCFLLGQAIVELGGNWPWGERRHGRAGLIEAYGEMLGMSDEAMIVRSFEYLTHKRIKGHWACPCGSGRVLRACHLEQVRNLQERIPRHIAKSALDRLKGGRS